MSLGAGCSQSGLVWGRPEIADFEVLGGPKTPPTGGPLRGPLVEGLFGLAYIVTQSILDGILDWVGLVAGFLISVLVL